MPAAAIGAFGIVIPLVWSVMAAGNAQGPPPLRHGIWGLEPECADGFNDDVEAVVTALLAYRLPIANLEGWLTARWRMPLRTGTGSAGRGIGRSAAGAGARAAGGPARQ